jgi:hypothetical protein
LDDLELDTVYIKIPRIPVDMTVVPVCTTFNAESNGTRIVKIVQADFEIIGPEVYMCYTHKV